MVKLAIMNIINDGRYGLYNGRSNAPHRLDDSIRGLGGTVDYFFKDDVGRSEIRRGRKCMVWNAFADIPLPSDFVRRNHRFLAR